MPKQILKVEKFDGGMFNASDPRDIPDNCLVQCRGMSVDNHGRLVTNFTFGNHESTAGTVPRERGLYTHEENIGIGLFTFSSDYEMLDPTDGTIYTRGC